MDKQEFLNRLRNTLSGSVPVRIVEENVNYYESYINSQMRMGLGEEDVMNSLGDPRLIAKSIISANDSNNSGRSTKDNYDVYDKEYDIKEQKNMELRVMGMPKWLGVLISCLVIFLIFYVITTLVSALLPIAIPCLLIYFLVKLFRDWLK